MSEERLRQWLLALPRDILRVKCLDREGRFDHLVIESTGVSEPMPVAETFTFTDESGFSLSDVCYMETEEYGISNFIYERRVPFHPQRFYDCLRQEWPGVIRSLDGTWE